MLNRLQVFVIVRLLSGYTYIFVGIRRSNERNRCACDTRNGAIYRLDYNYLEACGKILRENSCLLLSM